MELYTERRNLALWNPMWFHIPPFISRRDWKMLVLQQLWRCIVAANIVPSESQLISHHFTFTKLFIWEVQILSSLTADPKHQQHLKLYFEFTSHNVHTSFCKVPPLACLSFRVHNFRFPEALTAATPPPSPRSVPFQVNEVVHPNTGTSKIIHCFCKTHSPQLWEQSSY